VAFKQFAESSAAVVPQNLAVVGSALRELNDQFNVTAKGLTLITDKLKGADQGTIDQDLAALGLALRQQDTDRQRGVAGYFQQVAQGQQRTGAAAQQNVQDLIKGLQSANGQGLVDRPATTTGTDFGPGVTTTTASRNAPPRAEVVLTFDENGVAHAIQKHTSADRLLRVMGDGRIQSTSTADSTIPAAPAQEDDMKALCLVIRQGLLLIVAWIERRYNLRRTV
jgi:hypothetical protein